MAGFNTLPTKTVSGATTTTTSIGAFPVLVADPTYQGTLSTNSGFTIGGQNVQGFAQDGDYIIVPTSSTASMTYFDSSQVQITTGSWSGGILPTAITTLGVWVGMMMDATDGLLYVLARNSSTDVLQLASISVAGVITTIGSTLTLSAAFATQPVWVEMSTNGASMIRREADGVGNIFLNVFTGSTHTQELEINITTGAEVTAVHIVGQGRAMYKSANGNYVGGFDAGIPGTTTNNSIEMDFNSATKWSKMSMDFGQGIPASPSFLRAVQWNGRVVMIEVGGNSVFGAIGFTVAKFDAWVDAAALASGVV